LMASYKLPKASDEERTRRAVAIQTHLRGATDVPMACARACGEVIELAARVSHIGYKGVISDAGVGVLAAYAALRSAALNVFINAPALDDRPLADRYVAQIGELTTAGGLASEQVYKTVRERLES
ncbi:MAG: cyclodeaminase/cyclohydrolase family protein, partial [Pseudomonadota bacterium]|nr:cyclodeaminase/cyclohydrolase family protein [Pseudomonadota bacterium]